MRWSDLNGIEDADAVWWSMDDGRMVETSWFRTQEGVWLEIGLVGVYDECEL